MMSSPRALLAVALPSLASLAGCGGSPDPLTPSNPTSTGEAFNSVTCSAARPQTEPDLMGWDPASRANLSRLRNEGAVAVRYSATGCNVELELLSNCIAAGAYKYSPYSANETKIARNANELFAQLPVGAVGLSGKLRGNRALRTDYLLVGTESLPIGTAIKASDLKGSGCERATHVVSTIYVGGFAMVAGEASAIEASVDVFVAGAGAGTSSAREHVAREGNAEACTKVQAEGKASPLCSVPLRIALQEIEGRAPAPEPPPAPPAHAAAAAPAQPAQPQPAQASAKPAAAGPLAGKNERFSWTEEVAIDSKTGLSWYRNPIKVENWRNGNDLACTDLSAAGGGWRLPSIDELKSLIDRSKGIPPYDTAALSGIADHAYLSSSSPADYPDLVTYLTVKNGGTDTQHKGYGGWVLCVRKGSGTGVRRAPSTDSQFVLTAGTAKDKRTNLTWMRRDLGKMKNSEAIEACAGLVFEGKGWRLPTQEELKTIVELGRGAPTINRTVFPDSDDMTYVSSTKSSPSSEVYENVSFSTGNPDSGHDGYGGRVRCVR